MRQTQKMLPARILGIPTIAYRLVCLSGCLPSRDIGGGEERLAHLPCTARSVPSPSSPSFLPLRSRSLSPSLSKANFIGCYKFRPFQSPNRRRCRQPTPRASRGGIEATSAGLAAGYEVFTALFRFCHLTLRSLRIAASLVVSKCLYAPFEVERSPFQYMANLSHALTFFLWE